MTPSAYRDHVIRAPLDQLLLLKDHESMSAEAIAGNEQFSAARDTTFAMADVLKELLDRTPASRVSVHALNNMQKYVQAAANEVSAFTSNLNGNHLVNAANHFEQNIAPSFWGFTPIARGRESAKSRELIDSLSKSSIAAVQQVGAARDNILSHLQTLNETATSIQKKFEDLEVSAASERAQAAAAVSRLDQLFNAKEIERDNTFKKTLDNAKELSDQQRVADAVESAQVLSFLNEQKDKAEKIVQIVGNIGVTGNYQRIAQQEEQQANVWRRITVGLFLAGIALAIATFVKHFGDAVTPQTIGSIAVRLLYALVIAAPAWYTARESARHRTNADRARQTELELASLGPFIELLPREKKEAIREKMTEVYFGKDVAPHDVKPPVDMSSLKDFVVAVAGALRNK